MNPCGMCHRIEFELFKDHGACLSYAFDCSRIPDDMLASVANDQAVIASNASHTMNPNTEWVIWVLVQSCC